MKIIRNYEFRIILSAANGHSPLPPYLVTLNSSPIPLHSSLFSPTSSLFTFNSSLYNLSAAHFYQAVDKRRAYTFGLYAFGDDRVEIVRIGFSEQRKNIVRII